MNLKGTIPSELGTLSALNSLILSSNALSGTIPSELGFLKLTRIEISFNSLVGTIPPQLFSSGVTIFVHLNSNSLSGPIPQTLVEMKVIYVYFDASNNFLKGALPTPTATHIDEFEVSNNTCLFGPRVTYAGSLGASYSTVGTAIGGSEPASCFRSMFSSELAAMKSIKEAW